MTISHNGVYSATVVSWCEMKPLLTALLAAILFGAAAPIGKPLLTIFSPFQLSGLLYAGAALGVAFSVWKPGSQRRYPWNLDKRNRLRLLISITIGGVSASLCLMLGLRMASATSVSMWLVLETVLTALLAFLFFKEHLGKLGWLAIAGATTASAILSSSQGATGIVAGALVSGAALCWAIDNNVTAVLDGLTAPEITFWKGTAAGITSLCIAAVSGTFSPASPQQFAAAIALGAFAYGLSLLFYIRAAHSLGATRSQAVFATSPLWGVALAMLILHERGNIYHAVSAVLYAASIWLLLRDQHSHSHSHAEMSHVHYHTHDDGHHNHVHDEEVPASARHSHWHTHEALTHSHPHWPDLHHRHEHD